MRRPIRARDTRWAAATANGLARLGLRPNQISILSVVFAACSDACFALTPHSDTNGRIVLFLAAAAFIQLRLLCNLFDGMVAVEGGLRTKAGEIYNDLPDRFADAFILLGAGYSATSIQWQATLGWSATALALITAYVRVLGAKAGTSESFCGPMAKQHRMAVLTVAALLAAIESAKQRPPSLIAAALGVIAAGCVVTIARRVRLVLSELETK